MADKLMLGLPKGSLEQATTDMFAKAGYKIAINSRSYFPTIDDPEIECMLIRAQEMSRYVEEGILDCGLTGYDWIRENGSDVVEVAELVYGKVGRNPLRWVLAVPEDSNIHSVKDLEGKRYKVDRSKGLGENDPEMMWLTTMNPETRRLIKVMPEEAEATARSFDLLLGDNLQGRKNHIAENGYKYLEMIDVS